MQTLVLSAVLATVSGIIGTVVTGHSTWPLTLGCAVGAVYSICFGDTWKRIEVSS